MVYDHRRQVPRGTSPASRGLQFRQRPWQLRVLTAQPKTRRAFALQVGESEGGCGRCVTTLQRSSHTSRNMTHPLTGTIQGYATLSLGFLEEERTTHRHSIQTDSTARRGVKARPATRASQPAAINVVFCASSAFANLTLFGMGILRRMRSSSELADATPPKEPPSMDVTVQSTADVAWLRASGDGPLKLISG